MKSALLTGDRPSGALHLGHYIGSLLNRVSLQKSHESYLIVADLQALTDHVDQPSRISQYVIEVVKDYLAVGIDPSHMTIFRQSQLPELAELAFYFMNLVTVARLERNPTVKHEIRQKGLSQHLPVGFFCYPISQAADISAFGNPSGPTVVPVGEDQLPMIELHNEIVRKFNTVYGGGATILQEAEALLGTHGRLSGTDGKNKASKSLNNAIFLKDTEEEIKEKVYGMFTDPCHLRVQDPGNVEGNVVFEYLSAFDPNPGEVEDLKAQYQRGGLGDITLKNRLVEVLLDLLGPIRRKRESVSHEMAIEVLAEGTLRARHKARDTLLKVRKAMGIS